MKFEARNKSQMVKISKQKVRKFQRKILEWYATNKRDLPWRKTRDPYKILVSEVMLQQTQVSRVMPKYKAFLAAYPRLQDLAAGRRATLLTLWSGLGYNSRALRLQQLAKIVARNHSGKLPMEETELRALPGIGLYTARAVQIFVRNADTVCIDTNIRRILIHELQLEESLPPSEVEAIAQACLPHGRSREWHNALMDYGALVLTARKTGIKPQAAQTPFRQSKRYYRGQIMKWLVREKRVALRDIAAAYQKETALDIEVIVAEMSREGLIRTRGATLRL